MFVFDDYDYWFVISHLKNSEEVTLAKPVFIQHLLPDSIATLREPGNRLFRGRCREILRGSDRARERWVTDIHFVLFVKRRLMSSLLLILISIIYKCVILTEKSDQVVNRSLFHSNRDACHLKTAHCAAAIKDCTKSLELVPPSIKPLLRRGTCNAHEILERFVNYQNVIRV